MMKKPKGKKKNQQWESGNSPAGKWLSTNYLALPHGEWVAVGDEGLVAHFPQFMDLMFDLNRQSIKLSQVLLTKINNKDKLKGWRSQEEKTRTWEDDSNDT